MPFFWGGIWMFPMFMPLVMGGVVYFLYKKGVFNEICHVNDSTNLLGKNSTCSDLSPLEILKRRYAEGEISTEEYQKMKEELKE